MTQNLKDKLKDLYPARPDNEEVRKPEGWLTDKSKTLDKFSLREILRRIVKK